jgi:hypothetical protein
MFNMAPHTFSPSLLPLMCHWSYNRETGKTCIREAFADQAIRDFP